MEYLVIKLVEEGKVVDTKGAFPFEDICELRKNLRPYYEVAIPTEINFLSCGIINENDLPKECDLVIKRKSYRLEEVNKYCNWTYAYYCLLNP